MAAPAQARVVAQVGGHSDDVNAVAYGDPSAPTTIFSGSDDGLVKVSGGVVGEWGGVVGGAGWAVVACRGRGMPRTAGQPTQLG